MTTTSYNIVETFVYIPFEEASEITIDLLMKKTVVHNFLRILQSTFLTLPSQFKWNKAVPLLKQ